MQLVSESTATPAVINSQARRVSGGTAGGTAAIGKYLWTVYRIVDHFAFTVTTSEGAPLHTSAPEFGTAHKAERAAGEWCAGYVAPVEGPSADVPDVPDLAPLRWVVSGYRVEVIPYHRGGFIATATDLSTGNSVMDTIHETEHDAMSTALAWASANPREPAGVVGGWTVRIEDDRGVYTAVLEAPGRGTEVLWGFERRAAAIKAAAGWASANPCDGSPPFEEPSDNTDMSTPFDDPTDPRPLGVHPGELESPADREERQPARPAGDEVQELRARLALVETRLAAALARAPEDAATEYLALATREAELETQITGTKEILAGLKAELTRVRRSMTQKAVATMERISGRAQTEQLTISGVAFAGVGEAAARVRLGSATWAFNGTEHPIEHMAEETADGPRFTAWISGRRPFTEGHGETFEQAVDACKLAASTLFADMEQAGEDMGAVADGPRKTEKRGRPARLKGHDKAAVIAAVEGVLTWPEAADVLGCSEAQLEAYAGKVGLNLAKHQGRRAGEELALPEAPQAKAGRPRGRRKVGAK